MINLLMKDGIMKQCKNDIEATVFLETEKDNCMFVQIFDKIGYVGTVITSVYLRKYITRSN